MGTELGLYVRYRGLVLSIVSFNTLLEMLGTVHELGTSSIHGGLHYLSVFLCLESCVPFDYSTLYQISTLSTSVSSFMFTVLLYFLLCKF